MAHPERLQKQITFNTVWAVKAVLIYLWLFINIILYVIDKRQSDRQRKRERAHGVGYMGQVWWKNDKGENDVIKFWFQE